MLFGEDLYLRVGKPRRARGPAVKLRAPAVAVIFKILHTFIITP